MTEEHKDDPLLLELVLVFQQTAWQALGKVQNPATGKVEVHLPQARHAIDMLGMLATKTRGNLSDMESKVLANALTQLRLNYVESVEAKPAETPEKGAPQPETPSESQEGDDSTPST